MKTSYIGRVYSLKKGVRTTKVYKFTDTMSALSHKSKKITLQTVMEIYALLNLY